MSYKTILVYFDDETRVKGLSGYAHALAGENGAHLTGLTVMPSYVDVHATETRAMALVDDLREAYRAAAARMQALFCAVTSLQTVTTEWRLADPGFRHVVEAVAEQGQAADLIVASQDDPDWRNSGFRDSAGLLAVQSARPVLLVPRTGYPAGPARRIVAAWDGSREAARALFDALPMMKAASKVTLVSIQPWDRREMREGQVLSQQGEDLCSALSRHGANCTFGIENPSGKSTGANLLDAAARHSAELLIMGGYGHSRLGELVFGGVTRHVLTNMTIPVLLSH